ncbi:hypothetical protein HYALB_00003602 [Hymenoscyphus albidus]|uniref:Carboxylic ester hydrolase n=1 Tax=Hymenoscyphus albidus TaxID=595503 RepID=A0A9N9LYP4_9HELO|nr:hypothetical protein HYALB_00003602 [Hymenoscyphus albidus]
MKFSAFVNTFIFSLALASSSFNPHPFPAAPSKRQVELSNTSSLQVDLGYSVYEGILNPNDSLKVWKGIRFASPPTGELRWQAPRPPVENRSSVILADRVPNQCPQSLYNRGNPQGNLDFANTPGQSEDCLFLNVFAPLDAQNLPVLVWIHGGGYGEGNGDNDLGPIIATNNNTFIGVAFQYRLGAFGFLAGDEVDRNGVVNAGIRDQTFALQWVQNYIHLFGGDPRRVTISGDSAGGGSVMLQAMAYGGELGTSLFQNGIAGSPFLPMQHEYNSQVPSQLYHDFASAAGCLSGNASGSPSDSQSTFQCLVSKDYPTLQNASSMIGGSGVFGTWAFLPVTDGKFIQKAPSAQLLEKKVNGLRILSGNNALEGPLFVVQNITTEDSLVTFVKTVFPRFSDSDVAKTLRYYPGSIDADSTTASKYGTLGVTGPTANEVSAIATGHQQRANNIYGEVTFVCPSYWLAEAYDPNNGHAAYKYQYSVPPALHGMDATAYVGPAARYQGPDLLKAFMTIWGNFITGNNPSISSSIAIGASSHGNISLFSTATQLNVTNWPPYTNASPLQLNINQTGGQEFTDVGVNFMGEDKNVTAYEGPGLRNNFTLVNAFDWEGRRGLRCDFWRAMATLVPA